MLQVALGEAFAPLPLQVSLELVEDFRAPALALLAFDDRPSDLPLELDQLLICWMAIFARDEATRVLISWLPEKHGRSTNAGSRLLEESSSRIRPLVGERADLVRYSRAHRRPYRLEVAGKAGAVQRRLPVAVHQVIPEPGP